MEEQPVDIPCPICSVSGKVFMIAHVEEIPYFGEHTQVTVMCHSCGWRQTDFIPAEGKKPGSWSLVVHSSELLSARVIRSSSCTVKIHELDLEVAPGSNATGYVSNIEGVLNRFKEIVEMVLRDIRSEMLSLTEAPQRDEQALAEAVESVTTLEAMIDSIVNAGSSGALPLTLELLDPHGHSMILHDEALHRELTEEELKALPVGPDPAVFSSDDED
ncbi:MAG: ZPR1 zinc finger domain-containing protein [Candidatus Poseidoniaceae archaeon]|jgi:zinc finger protein|tara:strand:+ start:3701 stop:4351 length:651 start_codon:yes stop_codon:yes gene_type:complete